MIASAGIHLLATCAMSSSKRAEVTRQLSRLQVELKTGQTYRGELHEAEDNWNCQLKNVTATERVGVGELHESPPWRLAIGVCATLTCTTTQRIDAATWLLIPQDGRISHLDHVFLRGSRIRFMIIPDMLKNAPMFKRIDPKHKVRCLMLPSLPPALLLPSLPQTLVACLLSAAFPAAFSYAAARSLAATTCSKPKGMYVCSCDGMST